MLPDDTFNLNVWYGWKLYELKVFFSANSAVNFFLIKNYLWFANNLKGTKIKISRKFKLNNFEKWRGNFLS